MSHMPNIDARARQTSRIARGWFRMMKDSAAAGSAAQPDGSARAENAEAPKGQPSGQFPNLPAVPALADQHERGNPKSCQARESEHLQVSNGKPAPCDAPSPVMGRTLAAAGDSILSAWRNVKTLTGQKDAASDGYKLNSSTKQWMRRSESVETYDSTKSKNTVMKYAGSNPAALNSISTAEASSPHPLRPHVVDPNSAVETFSK